MRTLWQRLAAAYKRFGSRRPSDISPGSVANLTFTTQPSANQTFTAGGNIASTPVTLTVTDANNNKISGMSVSIALYSFTSTSDTLSSFSSGTLTATSNSSGLVSFTNLIKTSVGTYTLQATSSGIVSP